MQVSVEDIVVEIDAKIARLEQAKQLLSGDAAPKKGPGRPRVNAASLKPAGKLKRSVMSAAARAKVSAAQKARWAKAKKVKSKVATAKPEAAK
jgi:hypothetical protein